MLTSMIVISSVNRAPSPALTSPPPRSSTMPKTGVMRAVSGATEAASQQPSWAPSAAAQDVSVASLATLFSRKQHCRTISNLNGACGKCRGLLPFHPEPLLDRLGTCRFWRCIDHSVRRVLSLYFGCVVFPAIFFSLQRSNSGS